ncbi:2-succinyl-6-hydroxy-2, 4-cyclohexadiene-1-carboxylate synthase [Flavobacterium columnare]|uniref:2-succinyl-6-hydroxy-2, 4-cyclohexadiene-1-carboxylate synthase n=5 Tax=Flavobacterium TaxID=237 RepID=A0A2N9PDD0_9FLAO|nr:2-succinyl-6-hydroxy-2, 4-cyclohexadiene-1-carboxylate synthase [Flavobacterium columnare]
MTLSPEKSGFFFMNPIFYFTFTKSVGLYLNILSFLFPQKALDLAFTLFSSPRKGKLNKNKLPLFLEESKKEKLKYENATFQTYMWKGNETKILLVHGWESNSSRWEKIVLYLKNTGSTIIALDAPAHGLSQGKKFSVPQYSLFIHEVVQKYQPQYLIGHSIGGNACLYYQHVFPTEIKKIIVLGAPCDFEIILNNYIALLSLNSKLTKELKEKWELEYKQKIEDFSAQLFVQNSKIKGLIIHDIEDKTVAINEGKKIAQAWKESLFIETKELGHSLQDEKVFKEISAFLIE